MSEALIHQRNTLKEVRVNNRVTRLKAEALGVSAYRIKTPRSTVLIDCLPTFNPDLPAADAILFTHRDFMGASDRYHQHWGTEVYLHEAEHQHPLASHHHVSHAFSDDFEHHGIDAFVLGGHTPGFTVYIYRDVLFVCDLVVGRAEDMHFNPFGNREKIRLGAQRLKHLLRRRTVRTVCGFNYVTDFDQWMPYFRKLS
ncbi:MAG: hypothetical protein KC477_12205 [Oceanospirillaceae bacterium]|nr:hypothetical protein [Oceanospirillaceae bacterium]